MSTRPAPTVFATAVPNVNAAMKLKNAAHTTALPGVSTRVETTVAMELAASWKPLMKSKISATRISATTESRLTSIRRSGVLDDDAFEDVRDVFTPVGGSLQEVEDFLPLDDGDRIALLFEEPAHGLLVRPVRFVLQAVDFDGRLRHPALALERL